MATATVIGGGVSGLASAFYTLRYLPKIKKVILLESTSHLGGWVKTTINPDGAVFEHGPRSLRPVGEAGRNTLRLAEDLGLTRDILPVYSTDAAAKNRYLYVKGKLCALPNSLSGVLRTNPPFTKPLARYVAFEPLKRRSKQPDESIHSFISRRLGREMADIAFDAMCRGIFAGDCRQLSMQACFPPVHKLEKKYGSLVLGALLESKPPEEELTDLLKKVKQEKWSTWSLQRGLQQLTDGMAEAINNSPGAEIRLNSPVTAVIPKDSGKMLIETESDSFETDLVISAIYSKDLATVLPHQFSDLKEQLAALDSVNVVVVNLEYNDDILPFKGFGHLLPSSEGGPLLGIVYDSCTFPDQNRKGYPNSTRITVMMGGAWYDDLLTSEGKLPPGQDLVWMASQAAATHLGVKAHPVRSHVTLQKECIPQYRVGHMSWLESVEESILSHGLPIMLVGSSYRGPAINDCINNARKAVLDLQPKFSS